MKPPKPCTLCVGCACLTTPQWADGPRQRVHTACAIYSSTAVAESFPYPSSPSLSLPLRPRARHRTILVCFKSATGFYFLRMYHSENIGTVGILTFESKWFLHYQRGWYAYNHIEAVRSRYRSTSCVCTWSMNPGITLWKIVPLKDLPSGASPVHN